MAIEKCAYQVIDDFVIHRIASQCWCNQYEVNLKAFSKFCKRNYPEETDITQEMIDIWCEKKVTENNNSCRGRIYVVVNLVEYINIRENKGLKKPTLPKSEKYHYKPHVFTEKELRNLFYACDTIEIVCNRKNTILRKIMMPVLFRLIYSTGLRTMEIVHLKKKDVNLETGIINIQKSKGYSQHYTVLHDSMKQILINYEKEIENICPSRTYFFPAKNDNHYHRSWITTNFSKLWYKYNTNYAIAYDLRHNYAIENINSWYNVGIEFNSKLLSLSKSMGHSSIESTMYYYTLVPGLADKLEELTGKTFNELIPEVEYEE